jgi:uncharacterized protein (DUF1684 family)
MEIERERRLKDDYLRNDHGSPIPHEERSAFDGLKYYSADGRYRFRLHLQKYAWPEAIAITASDGTEKEYLRVGFFEFSLGGRTQRLQVYKSKHPLAPDGSLFIPFRDKTSGGETYGAARYIDIPENEVGIYELDFDKAYNPYCAYNGNYVCPYAPKENWLDVEIRAGERVYKST